MKNAVIFTIVCALVGPLYAQNRVSIPRAEFVAALKRSDPEFIAPVDRSGLSNRTVRVIRCLGPEEEPTEFQCTWQLRTKRGWKSYTNWLAVDADGWHLIG